MTHHHGYMARGNLIYMRYVRRSLKIGNEPVKHETITPTWFVNERQAIELIDSWNKNSAGWYYNFTTKYQYEEWCEKEKNMKFPKEGQKVSKPTLGASFNAPRRAKKFGDLCSGEYFRLADGSVTEPYMKVVTPGEGRHAGITTDGAFYNFDLDASVVRLKIRLEYDGDFDE